VHNYQNPQGAQSLSELLEPPKDFKMFDIIRADVNIDDFHVRVSDAGGANVFYEMLAGVWGTKIKHKVEALVCFLSLFFRTSLVISDLLDPTARALNGKFRLVNHVLLPKRQLTFTHLLNYYSD
jgi:hypothetical protein